MTDEEHNRILLAGVEFYSSLKELIQRYDLSEDDVPSIVLVAVGAVLGTTEMTPQQLTAGAEVVKQYWSVDSDSDMPLRAKFGRRYTGN